MNHKRKIRFWQSVRFGLAMVIALPVIPAVPTDWAGGIQPFSDVTAKVGIDQPSDGEVAWGDFDNDGWVDFYDGRLWRNEQGKKFSQVEGPFGGPGVWGDYNNDGFLDLYLYSEHKLLRGGGATGVFVAVEKGLPERPIDVSRGAVWGDIDGDGFLDLYIAGYEIWPDQEWPDVIFRNSHGQSFKEVWRTDKIERARGVTAADFDEDGDLDIYVSNYRLQPNRLLLNDGAGNVTDVGAAYGVDGDGDLGAWGHTIGSAFGDFDNDGHLDLLVGNFSHPPAYQDRPKFLRNLGPSGNFKFQDRSGEAGLAWQESFATPALGDFDNDGFLDLCLTAVYGGNHNVLVRNVSATFRDPPQTAATGGGSPVGTWRFQDVTAEAGLPATNTYQAAWADYDNDGHLDLAIAGRLLRNPGTTNHWLKIRLDGGAGTNRTAIGASVRVDAGGWILTRQVEGGMGEGNQNDLTLHFGLATHTGPVKILIRWPDGGHQSLVSDTNRTVEVKRER
ncbi:MAG: CRTAC1 family protein [Pirellulales bacterium]|nr:CRTAC1 family protein [Pirellulales bacterium]